MATTKKPADLSGTRKMAESASETSEKPPQRWFKFRISTMLLLTGILGIWLGVVANRAKDERQGTAAIRDAGGSVKFDYQYADDGEFIRNAKPPAPEVIRKAIGEEYFTNVVEAEANTQQFTNQDLSQLKGLKELRSLRIFETDVTDEGIRSLEALKRLEVVDLRNNDVTDAGLAILGKFTSLKKLLISGTNVTDEGVAHLSELHNLEVLFLSGTSVSDAGLAHLSGLQKLYELHLSGTRITDGGLVHIKELPLRDLLLSNTEVSDAAIVNLQELKSLGFISLIGTKVSDAGVSELKRQLPSTRVNR